MGRVPAAVRGPGGAGDETQEPQAPGHASQEGPEPGRSWDAHLTQDTRHPPGGTTEKEPLAAGKVRASGGCGLRSCFFLPLGSLWGLNERLL